MVDFGDKSIDLSVASRVNKINSLLQGMFQQVSVLKSVCADAIFCSCHTLL